MTVVAFKTGNCKASVWWLSVCPVGHLLEVTHQKAAPKRPAYVFKWLPEGRYTCRISVCVNCFYGFGLHHNCNFIFASILLFEICSLLLNVTSLSTFDGQGRGVLTHESFLLTIPMVLWSTTLNDLDQSVNQSWISRVARVTKSLQDPLRTWE